jgi:WD40 repeat protein
MDLNVALGAVVSVDARGMIEYWSCSTLTFPAPDDPSGAIVSFQYKTETDLYALAKVCELAPLKCTFTEYRNLKHTKSSSIHCIYCCCPLALTFTRPSVLSQNKVIPGSVSVSPRGDLFVITSSDKQIRVFNFRTGKLHRAYNESSAVYTHTSVATSTISHLSEHDLGRRLATEREIEADADALAHCNAVFDDSGNFLVSMHVRRCVIDVQIRGLSLFTV